MGMFRAEQVERDLVKDGASGNEKVEEKNKETRKGFTKGLGHLRKRMEEVAVARGESEGPNAEGSSALDEDEGEEEEEEEDPMDPLTVLRNIGRQLKKEAAQLDEDEGMKRKELEERRADLERLERVELLYVSCTSWCRLCASSETHASSFRSDTLSRICRAPLSCYSSCY